MRGAAAAGPSREDVPGEVCEERCAPLRGAVGEEHTVGSKEVREAPRGSVDGDVEGETGAVGVAWARVGVEDDEDVYVRRDNLEASDNLWRARDDKRYGLRFGGAGLELPVTKGV